MTLYQVEFRLCRRCTWLRVFHLWGGAFEWFALTCPCGGTAAPVSHCVPLVTASSPRCWRSSRCTCDDLRPCSLVGRIPWPEGRWVSWGWSGDLGPGALEGPFTAVPLLLITTECRRAGLRFCREKCLVTEVSNPDEAFIQGGLREKGCSGLLWMPPGPQGTSAAPRC